MFEIWNKTLSRTEVSRYLSREEYVVWENLPLQKQRSWLNGRLAAKRLLQKGIKQASGKRLSFAEIEITSAGKRPVFRCTRQGGDFHPGNHCLSISHTKESGIAALSFIPDEGLVGIDMENERQFTAAFLEAFLTKNERDSIFLCPPQSRDAYATLYWCYKEAYLKARGTGLRTHPQSIEISMDKNGEPSELRQDGRKTAFRSKRLALPGRKIGVIVYAPIG